MRKLQILLAYILSCTSVHAAESLSEGVANLALQIIEKTQAEGEVTIGITSFPHADKKCSKFSNLLSDDLVFALFEVGEGKLKIVERSQLETIFQELKFSQSGAVDTKTAIQLGKIHGVDALVVGTIPEFGDRLRINARLIETKSGTVFSAARTNVPVTGAVKEILTERSHNLCGYSESERSEVSKYSQDNKRVDKNTIKSKMLDFPHFQNQGMLMSVVSARRHNNNISVNYRIMNNSNSIKLIKWHGSSFSDSNGNVCAGTSYETKVVGIPYGNEAKPLVVRSGEIIQFNALRIDCESNKFSGMGAISAYIGVYREGEDVFEELRFNLFDVSVKLK